MIIELPDCDWIAGVDEVGRGPLAGDVVTAAVILDIDKPIAGLGDSKALSEKRREKLYEEIIANAKAWSLGRATVAEIDRYNILQATMMAMVRAVESLAVQPEYVLVDGNRTPKWRYPSKAIVKGDGSVDCISAASILAKVTRDREMLEYEKQYPGYGFARHKGYGTAEHRQAIEKNGPCPIHRLSFEPLKTFMNTHVGQNGADQEELTL